MSFLEKFDEKYYELLKGNVSKKKKITYPNIAQRSEPFRLIFSLLEGKNKKSYNIVETGVIRNIGNWNDGQSSLLFQEFLKLHNGSIKSVDISIDACNIAISFLDPAYAEVTCDDSVKFLSTVNVEAVDLFFLDSYDVVFKNDKNSADHHLKEFMAIESRLAKGTLIAIDDNTYFNGNRSGKGRKIFEYLQEKNIHPIYDGYIIIYNWD
jgi:predicted O-methyltransferase YrrM